MDKELKVRIQENKVLTSQERKNVITDLEKLEKIERIVKEWENSKIVTNCYECAEQIKEVLEKE